MHAHLSSLSHRLATIRLKSDRLLVAEETAGVHGVQAQLVAMREWRVLRQTGLLHKALVDHHPW